jgi:Rrf2 family transcriptional regulator, iron-sulfur cluster assembly transcription factor
MIFSRTCEYAIRAMTRVADEPEKLMPAEEIAEAEEVPLPVLSKILQELVRKGLLESRRGPGGGFRLSRRAELITLRDIVAVVDGLDHFMDCVAGLKVCSEDAPCPLHNTWKGMRTQILSALETTTLVQMSEAVRMKNDLVLRQARSRS